MASANKNRGEKVVLWSFMQKTEIKGNNNESCNNEFRVFLFRWGFIKVHGGNDERLGWKISSCARIGASFSTLVSLISNFDIFCDFSRSIARLKCLWWELEHDFYQRNWRYHKLFPWYSSRLCTIFDRHMSRMFARCDIKRQWMLETQTGSIVELILLFFSLHNNNAAQYLGKEICAFTLRQSRAAKAREHCVSRPRSSDGSKHEMLWAVLTSFNTHTREHDDDNDAAQSLQLFSSSFVLYRWW